MDKVYDGFDEPLGEVLLTPTRIYVKTIMDVLKGVKVKGIANITGGGFIENIPRVMPNGLGAKIDKNTWTVPEVFNFLQRHGQVSEEEMYNVFNMGISMIMVVSPEDAEKTIALAQEGVVMGKVIAGEGVCFA